METPVFLLVGQTVKALSFCPEDYLGNMRSEIKLRTNQVWCLMKEFHLQLETSALYQSWEEMKA